MSEFQAIRTQEDFERAIQARLDRERQKYADYGELKRAQAELETLKAQDYEGQLTQLRAQLEEASAQLESRETDLAALRTRAETAEMSNLRARVARSHGIPYELSDRIAGTTEEELHRDAEALSRYVQPAHAAPLASTESGVRTPLARLAAAFDSIT